MAVTSFHLCFQSIAFCVAQQSIHNKLLLCQRIQSSCCPRYACGLTQRRSRAQARRAADRATPKWGPVRYAVGR